MKYCNAVSIGGGWSSGLNTVCDRQLGHDGGHTTTGQVGQFDLDALASAYMAGRMAIDLRELGIYLDESGLKQASEVCAGIIARDQRR
jgi:hypothetical protein